MSYYSTYPKKPYGKIWTEKEENSLFDMAKNQVPRPRIAEKLGRTERAIELRLLKVGSEMMEELAKTSPSSASGDSSGGPASVSNIAKLLGFTREELMKGFEFHINRKEQLQQKKDNSMEAYTVPLLRKISKQLGVLLAEIKDMKTR